jgi:hypothetical protein
MKYIDIQMHKKNNKIAKIRIPKKVQDGKIENVAGSV